MNEKLILGIDVANIRGDGTITHITEVLKAANPAKHGFSKVIVWGGKDTLEKMEERPWLKKAYLQQFDNGLLFRSFWQCFRLSSMVRRNRCDVLFVPGGSYAGNFHPMVTLSQNLLPFEWRELRRYGCSFLTLKLLFLRWIQSSTFRKADGLIFLTRYAQNVVMKVIKSSLGKTVIIPLGVGSRFFCKPHEQIYISKYSVDRPFCILYVSIVTVYKHQWYVAEAVAQLRKAGYPITLDLVGPSYPPALKRLKKALDCIDPKGEFVRYLGPMPYNTLHEKYGDADLCLFASSCENLPNILLEGMASALPVVCSNRGPMPEVLGNAGIYFDPENPRDIARAVKEMIDSPILRAEKAMASFTCALAYSWERCADETFEFLAKIASAKHGKKSRDV